MAEPEDTRPVRKVEEYRYGIRASDTTIQNVYLVTCRDAQVGGYEVCRPGRGAQKLPDGTQLPKIFDRFSVIGPDNSDIENILYRVLPGGISATRSEKNASQWYVTVTFTQTPMRLFDITDFKIGKRSYRRVAPGAYERIEVRPTGEPVTIAADKRVVPFTNASKEFYDPADHQEEFESTILQFTRRESLEFDYVKAVGLRGTLNDSKLTLFGFPVEPNQAKILTLAPVTNVDEDGKLRWFTYYEIEIMPEGETHNIRLQNQGFYAKFPTPGQDVALASAREILISDIDPNTAKGSKTDKPVTKPQALKVDGTLEQDATANWSYYEFRTKRHTDWSTELEFPENAIDYSGDEEVLEGQL